jgi:hypothetical protein
LPMVRSAASLVRSCSLRTCGCVRTMRLCCLLRLKVHSYKRTTSNVHTHKYTHTHLAGNVSTLAVPQVQCSQCAHTQRHTACNVCRAPACRETHITRHAKLTMHGACYANDAHSVFNAVHQCGKK